MTRYYIAQRTGGVPWGWQGSSLQEGQEETLAVKLTTQENLMALIKQNEGPAKGKDDKVVEDFKKLYEKALAVGKGNLEEGLAQIQSIPLAKSAISVAQKQQKLDFDVQISVQKIENNYSILLKFPDEAARQEFINLMQQNNPYFASTFLISPTSTEIQFPPSNGKIGVYSSTSKTTGNQKLAMNFGDDVVAMQFCRALGLEGKARNIEDSNTVYFEETFLPPEAAKKASETKENAPSGYASYVSSMWSSMIGTGNTGKSLTVLEYIKLFITALFKSSSSIKSIEQPCILIKHHPKETDKTKEPSACFSFANKEQANKFAEHIGDEFNIFSMTKSTSGENVYKNAVEDTVNNRFDILITKSQFEALCKELGVDDVFNALKAQDQKALLSEQLAQQQKSKGWGLW